MKKYLFIILCLINTTFAFDNGYLTNTTIDYNQYDRYESTTDNEAIAFNGSMGIYEAKNPPSSCRELPRVVNKKLSSPQDIKIFKTKNIEPISYTNTVSLNKLQVSEKKQKFFYMLLPAILISKQRLKAKRNRVEHIINNDNPTAEEIAFLDELYETYETSDNQELLSRMKTHPVSIILAQAAIESAWGESRFFKEGNNIFGMWSYNVNEPRIRAKKTRNGKAVYVRKYATLSDAIDDYFEVIGRGAYKNFRKQRDITKDPLKLVEYLVNYCELKEQYTKKLKKFIIANKLEKFDDYKIDREYLITKNF